MHMSILLQGKISKALEKSPRYLGGKTVQSSKGILLSQEDWAGSYPKVDVALDLDWDRITLEEPWKIACEQVVGEIKADAAAHHARGCCCGGCIWIKEPNAAIYLRDGTANMQHPILSLE